MRRTYRRRASAILRCLGKEENANVVVANCFVSNTKHFPVDFKSHLPITTPNPQNFKPKFDLAKGIPFKSLATDAWYTSTELIEFVASKNVCLTAEVRINRSIFFTHPQTKQRRYLTDDKDIHILITTDLVMSVRSIILTYLLR